MRFLIINTKGGCGKSFLSANFLPLYFEESGKIPLLLETDPENKDAESYNDTAFFNRKHYDLFTDDGLRLPEYLIDNENLIIDCGGNKSSSKMIDVLEDMGDLKYIDAVLIPFTDGEQDSLNAYATYCKIKEIDSNVKIVFVLSRVDSSLKDFESISQSFTRMFGDPNGRYTASKFKGFVDEIEDKDKNFISLSNFKYYTRLRVLGYTIQAYSKLNIDDMEKSLVSNVKKGSQAYNLSESERMKLFLTRKSFVNSSKKYINEKLKPELNKLIDVLNK